MKEKFIKYAYVFCVLTVLNMTVFGITIMFLGGDALGGKIEEGRFFVSNHGNLTEVSQSVWLFNYYHAIFTVVTIPLALVSFWIACQLDKD